MLLHLTFNILGGVFVRYGFNDLLLRYMTTDELKYLERIMDIKMQQLEEELEYERKYLLNL